MFTAIIATFISWIDNIFWKKSLWYNIWWKMHDILSYPVAFLIIIYFFYSWIDLSKVDYILAGSAFILLFIGIFKTQIRQWIYREEKISVIVPYTNVNKVLSIILAFFVFSDVSKTSLLITILAIIVVIIFSINFKTFKLPKNITKMLIVETVTALTLVWTWWLISNYWEKLYFIFSWISWAFILMILITILWEFKTIKWQPKSFWINRYIWSIWWFAWFLSLVVISNLWLSVSIILSFFWIWITLLLAFIFLKDKPSKKDLLLTLIVTVLVWLAFLYR